MAFPSATSSFEMVIAGSRIAIPKLLATPKLFVWSAADKDGLVRLANVYSTYLSRISLTLAPKEEDTYLENLAYTLASRRSSLAWKSVAVASSVSALRQLEVKMSAPIRSRVKPSLGFIFTGQGAQYAGMGRELQLFSVFRASLDRSETYLRRLGCIWSLKGTVLTQMSMWQILQSCFL